MSHPLGRRETEREDGHPSRTLLGKQCLDGIYVIPKAMTPFGLHFTVHLPSLVRWSISLSAEWMGVIFLRKGYYQSGIFRFCLCIPETFPDTQDLPRLRFEQPIFHPFIHPTELSLDLGRYFREGWKPGTHHIYHALIFLQRAFYSLAGDLSAAPNQEAASLLQTSPQTARERIAESVRRSRELVYEETSSPDPHAIRFSPWDTAVHERQRVKLLTRRTGRPTGVAGDRSRQPTRQTRTLLDSLPRRRALLSRPPSVWPATQGGGWQPGGELISEERAGTATKGSVSSVSCFIVILSNLSPSTLQL